MAGYNEIRGLRVKYLSDDPSNAEDGQVWYNSTTGNLRVQGIGSGAWASASPLITGRQGLAGGGTQTACAFWGGSGPTNSTEEYNGSGFSTGGNLPYSAVYLAGCGTQTAGLACGGDPGPTQVATACTYDGASWTGIPSLNTARSRIGATGTTSAALAFGGGNPWGINNSEEYSGSSWAEGNNLNTARRVNNSGGGPQTAGIVAGGDTGPPSAPSAHTEEYDGSSWTTATNLGTATREMGSSGTQTAFLVSGGLAPSASTTCQQYDGTSWTTLPAALPSAINQHDQEGTTLAAISTGGTPNISATNEYNFSSTTVTAGAWAAGGALNTARRSMFTGPMGSQTAGLAAGGYVGPARTNATEEYNGASWTSVNNTTDTLSGRGSAGTQTAGLLFGGNPSPSTVTDTEEYDGTNWTAGGALNNARGNGPIAAGTQTAALCAGGYNPPVAHVTVVEYYNGSAWTAQPNANPNNYAGASGGTQDAAWFIGSGAVSPGPANTEAYNWDGTSWTASGNYGTISVANCFGGGTQTAGWMCGGDADPGFKSFTNHYDGTVWSTAPSLGTARSGYGQSGIQSSGLIFGGGTPSNTTATEEFTGETVTTNPASNVDVS